VRLIPVVKLEPGICASGDRARIALGGDGHSFWVGASPDEAVVRLLPVKEGCWLVSIDQLTDPRVLEFLVRSSAEKLTEDEEPAGIRQNPDPDSLTVFSGGFALCIDGDVRITPRCCGDLSDIEQWQTAADHRGAEKVAVWIGHPWIQVHFDGEELVFTEGDEEQGVEISHDCGVAPDLLQESVSQARLDLDAFCRRLLPVVARFVPSGRARETARNLAGSP
jgi:hypothetical protein